jgi:hypothetical protein
MSIHQLGTWKRHFLEQLGIYEAKKTECENLLLAEAHCFSDCFGRAVGVLRIS